MLVEELKAGKHPELAELLDAGHASKPNEGLPVAATPGVAIDPPPLPDPADTTWRTDPSMELVERRMRAISSVISEKEFKRMSLERGDKGTIKSLCEHFEPELFRGATVFDAAWKRGSKWQWWRMEDYAKFMKHRRP